MTSATARDSAILSAVAAQRGVIVDATRFVHEHPELAHEEFECAAYLSGVLGAELEVTAGFGGMPTGFSATLTGGHPGPAVGIVAVYDAVGMPDGAGGLRGAHNCGHGPISGAVVGAALALAALKDDLHGTVVVLGIPADELVSPKAIAIGSGKALSVAAGAWAAIDYALYPHPESATGVWHSSRWMQLSELILEGPHDPADWNLPFDKYRIDGVSVLPSGSTRVVLRVLGDDSEAITKRTEDVRALVPPATWAPIGLTQGLTSDPTVVSAVEGALEAIGLPFDPATPLMPFSTDFGNVSHVVPSAMIGVTRDGGWAVHTDEGEAQFLSPLGDEIAVTMAEVIAVTTDRLLRNTA